MITDEGAIQLLNYQLSSLANCHFALFTNNATISNATVKADLTLAAWSGYADVVCGSLNTPTTVGGRASTSPVVQPVFSNGSGGAVTFYGWCLYDNATGKLIAAQNVGATTIPAGTGYALTATLTDKEE